MIFVDDSRLSTHSVHYCITSLCGYWWSLSMTTEAHNILQYCILLSTPSVHYCITSLCANSWYLSLTPKAHTIVPNFNITTYHITHLLITWSSAACVCLCVCVCVCCLLSLIKLGYGGAATTNWMMKKVKKKKLQIYFGIYLGDRLQIYFGLCLEDTWLFTF